MRLLIAALLALVFAGRSGAQFPGGDFGAGMMAALASQVGSRGRGGARFRRIACSSARAGGGAAGPAAPGAPRAGGTPEPRPRPPCTQGRNIRDLGEFQARPVDPGGAAARTGAGGAAAGGVGARKTPPECAAPDLGAVPRAADGTPAVRTWGPDVAGARVAVLTPAYGGSVHASFHLSMSRLYAHAARRGFTVTPLLVWNESLVPRARNYLLMDAMASAEDFTHIMFIDADIEFPAEAVERLVARDAPMSCGIYPKKQLLAERLVQLARERPDLDAADLLAQAVGYVVTFQEDARLSVDDYWVEVEECGTGFLMMQRGAVEAMWRAFPHLRNGSSESVLPGVAGDALRGKLYHLFDTQIDPDTLRYLSEDYVFLKRWREIGGRVLADLSANLGHHGSYVFQGRPWEGMIDRENARLREGYRG